MCIVSCLCFAVPLSTEEVVQGEFNSLEGKKDEDLQNIDFVFNFLSDNFEDKSYKSEQDSEIVENQETKKFTEIFGNEEIINDHPVEGYRSMASTADEYEKEDNLYEIDNNSQEHKPTSKDSILNNIFRTNDIVGSHRNVQKSKSAKYAEVKGGAGQVFYQIKPKLLVPKIEGSYGRQNKIYWTDEELTSKFASNEHSIEKEKSEATESSLRKSHSTGVSNVKERIYEKSQKNYTDANIFDVIDPHVDIISKEDKFYKSFAQDRQFAMSLSDLSVNTIQDIFEETMLKLPNDIDLARDIIIEKIAKKNMLGYTIAFGYFLGAALDTIADFLFNERFLTDIILDRCLWFHLGWLWFYAAGFAGPWLFPSTFNGGDPDLLCSSEDFFTMLADTELNTDISSITSGSESEVLILSERLRLVFRSRLNCIVGKRKQYPEAEFVHGTFERILDLINLHHRVNTPVRQETGLDLLDAELRRIWDNLPVLVEEVHSDVTASRANRSRIFVFIGLLNLIASIFGVLMELCGAEYANIPGIPGGAPFIDAINSNLKTFIVDGRFSNDFVLGEGFYAVAEFFGWGYSYHMTYFLFVEEADPGCGLEEMDNVYSRYQQLRSLQVLMSTGEVSPEVAKYFVAEWKRELGVAFHCLLTTEEGTGLSDTIEMFVTLANYRLDRS